MNSKLNETPTANRVHIAFFGERNSGKSSIINALTGQSVSIVSDVAGTTTDAVYKPMEIAGIGPCMLIDTAGFDDVGELGSIRVKKTEKIVLKTDLAVLLFSHNNQQSQFTWYAQLRNHNIPVIPVISKADVCKDVVALKRHIEETIQCTPLIVSAKTKDGIALLLEELIKNVPEDFEKESITSNLVKEKDLVLLVMPQDIQAPKGRLILPQVQVLRELLDKKCIVMSVTTDELAPALLLLKNPPTLIITDSQVFKTVYDLKPKESLLTSFSMLFAAYKGDIEYYKEGAKVIDRLDEHSKVLIAECCTHAPLKEDIGREKLPRLLRKKVGVGLTIDLVTGADFKNNLEQYDLIIQCGACMFNRKYVLARTEMAKRKGVPMSNYGVVLAYLSGILSDVTV